MRNAKYSRNAKCPYYQNVLFSQIGSGIECEPIEDNLGFDVKTLLRFRCRPELDDYFELFCADMYENCPYHKAIDNKYKREGN